MDSNVVSCPPCIDAVEVNTQAGLPASAPLSHRAEVPSRKCLSGAARLPKRVGLPSASPAQDSRSRSSQYGAPSGGIAACALCVTDATFGTVRRRAAAPGTRSTPCATSSAMRRTDPPTL